MNWKYLIIMVLICFGQNQAIAQKIEPINLAQGRPYNITATWPDPLFTKFEEHYPDTNQVELTDGYLGEVRYQDSAWQAFLRQGKRIIEIDLGEIQTINQIQGRFLQMHSAGVYVPRYIDYSLSLDGKDWFKVGHKETQVGPWNRENQVEVINLKNLKHLARWVKLEFEVDGNVFMDEIEVWGWLGIVEAAKTLDPIKGLLELTHENPESKKGVLKAGSKQAAGACHIALLTYAYPPNPQDGIWYSLEYLPYITYISEEAVPIDWMFDTVLLCPQGTTPSGRNLNATKVSEAATIDDWKWYLEETFRPNQQISALNQAVGIGQKLLNEPDKKIKVILTLINPSPLQQKFGSLKVSGESLNFDWNQIGIEQSLKNRLSAIEWLMDELLTSWEAENPENLELIGFYWQPEAIRFQFSPKEDIFINKVADLVHKRGYKLFWIPFYGAEGSYNWQQYGFDVAILQPNYMFSEVGEERLKLAFEIASSLGMGVEIEKHWVDGKREREIWQNYLIYGVKYGYSDAVCAYYQGFKDLERAALNYNTRFLYYESVYQFIKGKYQLK